MAGSTVSAVFRTVAAHASVLMRLTLKAPNVSSETTMSVTGKFFGENMHMDEKTLTIPVLPPTSNLLMVPSGRTVQVSCGGTVGNAVFGSDTEGQLQGNMACPTSSGLTFTAPGKTLNLAGKRIVSGTRLRGNAGLIIGPNAPNVVIKGGGTSGDRGIEHFEYCVKDMGGNTGLQISDLRCFRAKSVGILSLSNEVLISGSMVDRSTRDASNENPAVGGIGIQVGGDNVRVKDTIIRRSAEVGFWAHGVDSDGSGVAATYEGNTTTSSIESNAGVGVVLEGGPHRLKDTQILGETSRGRTSLEGVVVQEGCPRHRSRWSRREEVLRHAIHVGARATDTIIARTKVEDIGGNGFVIDAPTTLSGNSASDRCAEIARLIRDASS